MTVSGMSTATAILRPPESLAASIVDFSSRTKWSGPSHAIHRSTDDMSHWESRPAPDETARWMLAYEAAAAHLRGAIGLQPLQYSTAFRSQ